MNENLLFFCAFSDKNSANTLTDAGAKIANMIFERHTELREILLHIGVSETTASQDACRIEHYISPETFEALKAYFKDKI